SRTTRSPRLRSSAIRRGSASSTCRSSTERCRSRASSSTACLALVLARRIHRSPWSSGLSRFEGGPRLERELPGLSDQGFAEPVVWLVRHAREAGRPIEASRGQQIRLRPQRDLLVADAAREADAFLDQPFADAQPARRLLDV